jgi:glycine oxidase
VDRSFDVVVAGAGIMGLSCALELARRGRKVGVFDPAGTKAQASWAAAGILVTRDAHAFSSAFREFYVRSIRLYPEWLSGVSALAGKEVHVRRSGDYLVFDLEDPEGRRRLEAKSRQLERERATDFTITDTLPEALRGRSPLAKAKVFHFPGEGYVQNRDLLEALRAACARAGVLFLAEAPSHAWEFRHGKSHFAFSGERWEARQVLLAAGSWSLRVLEALGITAPMTPVKGQMVRIPKFHDSEAMIHFNDNLYLIPRGDSLVAGATTEPGVWDEGFDQVGEDYVESHFRKLLPGIPHHSIESWSGLRPRTKDRLPWMGWLDADRGWAICTGHYKCGISMAPLAAQCLTKTLLGEKTPYDLSPFNPWRKQGLTAS